MRASAVTGPVRSVTLTRSRGTPSRRDGRTRPQATGPRGAPTAGGAGRRSRQDVSSVTAGRSPPTPTILTAGTSPPRPDLARRTSATERTVSSTAGKGTLGARCPCPASRCRTRSPQWQTSSSAPWLTGGCSTALIAEKAGGSSQSRRRSSPWRSQRENFDAAQTVRSAVATHREIHLPGRCVRFIRAECPLGVRLSAGVAADSLAKVVSVQPLPSARSGSDQRGRGARPRGGRDRLGEEAEEGVALQPAGLGDGEHALGEALPGLGLAAEGDLAVDDRAAQPALGAVVGRFHSLDLGEGPKRRPELEQVAGEGAEVAVADALFAVRLEQRPQAALGGSDLALETVAIPVGREGFPRAEQLAADLQARLAEALLIAESLGVAAEVAQQVRPADLAAGRVELVVGPPAIRGDDPGEARADQLGQLALVAIGGDVEGGEAVGERGPQGAALPGAPPAGLIDADHGGVLDRLAQLGIGVGESAAGALADRVHRADRDSAPEQLPAEL